MTNSPGDHGFQIKETANGATFAIKVQAGGGRTGLVGFWEHALKIKVNKKPEHGAANRECLSFLARRLGVPLQRLRIVTGEFSHLKVIAVEGLQAIEVQRRLLEEISGTEG